MKKVIFGVAIFLIIFIPVVIMYLVEKNTKEVIVPIHNVHLPHLLGPGGTQKHHLIGPGGTHHNPGHHQGHHPGHHPGHHHEDPHGDFPPNFPFRYPIWRKHHKPLTQKQLFALLQEHCNLCDECKINRQCLPSEHAACAQVCPNFNS